MVSGGCAGNNLSISVHLHMFTQHGYEDACRQLLQGRIINAERCNTKYRGHALWKGMASTGNYPVVDVRFVREVESVEA